jgi:hypothetical protein
VRPLFLPMFAAIVHLSRINLNAAGALGLVFGGWATGQGRRQYE